MADRRLYTIQGTVVDDVDELIGAAHLPRCIEAELIDGKARVVVLGDQELAGKIFADGGEDGAHHAGTAQSAADGVSRIETDAVGIELAKALPRIVGEESNHLVAVEIGDGAEVVEVREVDAAIVIHGVAIELQHTTIGVVGEDWV